MISHDINVGTWRIAQAPEEGESMSEAERQFAFESLDRWMTEREQIYRHRIFTHPGQRPG